MSKKYLGKYWKDWLHKDTSSDRSCRCCRNCCRSQLESLNRTLNRKDLRDRSSEDRRASCQVGSNHVRSKLGTWKELERSDKKIFKVSESIWESSLLHKCTADLMPPKVLLGHLQPCEDSEAAPASSTIVGTCWNMQRVPQISTVSCAVSSFMAPLRTTASMFGRPAPSRAQW